MEADSYARYKTEVNSSLLRTAFPAIVVVAALLAVLGRMALAQQDKYTVQRPNGLAFSEFRGYEDWQVVAVSQTEELLKVEVAQGWSTLYTESLKQQ